MTTVNGQRLPGSGYSTHLTTAVTLVADYVTRVNDVIGNSSATTAIDEQIVISNQNQVLNVLLTIIGSLGLLGNLLVVVVIFQYTKMRRVLTNIYVINQSIIDGSAGLMLILTTVFEDDGLNDLEGLADDLYCRLWLSKVPLWSMLFSSTYNLVALTLERYVAVAYPIWHRLSLKRSKVAASLLVVWLVGLCIQVPLKVATGYISGGRCHTLQRWPSPLAQRATGVLLVVLQFILPIAIIAFCYCRMFQLLKANKIAPANPPPGQQTHQPSGKEGPSGKLSARARRNIFKTLVIVSVCYIICWVWNQGYFFLFNLGVIGNMFQSTYYHFSVIAAFLNCCINPIIYLIHYEQFRQGLYLLKRRLLRQEVGPSGDTTAHHSIHSMGPVSTIQRTHQGAL